MFYVKHPSDLDQPWTLSKKTDTNLVVIPLEVSKLLKNHQIMAIEFLYHNYRKGIKGSILNQEPGMNFPLQITALFRALLTGSGVILIICPEHSLCFWHYHLVNHGDFTVVQITEKNSKNNYEGNNKKLALLLQVAHLKLCEDLANVDFFSVIIENFDQIANKLIIKRLNGKFNIGLTYRSFYTNPDQKLQWKMLNWANPGCVGKLNDFYEVDNKNFDDFKDNYRYWWMRLTWKFCESFQKPGDEETEIYERTVADWAAKNSLNFPEMKKSRKRKHVDKTPTVADPEPVQTGGDSSSDTVINEVPIDKYVKLPSMDENPILTSIIKNFEISPEPILTRTYESLPYTLTQPNCSKYEEDSNVILSFIDNKERPSTSKSESEDFIINLIKKPESDEPNTQDIKGILNKADAVLQN
ncbi:hypothetical protein BDFB_007973 [Asbolus verrucosus]|uniref:Uncharacterized protein n=1 Tax=Asbolus verrucosus TaxID=1661398 RepID=A0A482V9U5_ASBVE|nr:hypothetical protein BDFB_007973 [Asbolus verrucosus]